MEALHKGTIKREIRPLRGGLLKRVRLSGRRILVRYHFERSVRILTTSGSPHGAMNVTSQQKDSEWQTNYDVI